VIAWFLAAIVAGSLVYCVLVIIAAQSWRRDSCLPRRDSSGRLPLSVLKPLAGVDDGLEANLRCFFEQDYADYELLFAVREAADPAVAVVERLQAAYPARPSRLIITGEPPYPNAKVYSLDHMTREARSDVLVMSDSDIRVGPDFLRTVAAEFSNPRVGVSTCPYRAVGGPSIWSRLEAVGMNTEFIGGVLVAQMLEGMKFALGPTLTARREVLEPIGGWNYLKDFLAEDFVLGNRAAEMGFGVVLSSYVVEHRIGSQPWRSNFKHRLRWNRSTRRSRPAGYIGQVFTNPIPLALLLGVARPDWWMVVALTVVIRYAAAYATCVKVLRDRLSLLMPVQDILSFAFWIAGFFGRTIQWRGRRYLLRSDGRFELLSG
jgi:ceramide glucosyltransferase